MNKESIDKLKGEIEKLKKEQNEFKDDQTNIEIYKSRIKLLNDYIDFINNQNDIDRALYHFTLSQKIANIKNLCLKLAILKEYDIVIKTISYIKKEEYVIKPYISHDLFLADIIITIMPKLSNEQNEKIKQIYFD